MIDRHLNGRLKDRRSKHRRWIDSATPLRRWLRSPLLHFVLAGAVLATLQSLLWPGEPARPEPVIVDAGVLAGLTRDWARASGRTPTNAELDLLVQDWVDQELLVRQALALGLEHNDALIERRLIQNQRFVESGTRDSPLSDAELLARALALGLERTDLVVRRRLVERMREIILSGKDLSGLGGSGLSEEHDAASDDRQDSGPTLPWIRLTQLYLSRDRHGRDLAAVTTSLLEKLRGPGLRPDSPEVARLGDPFLLPRDLPRMTTDRLSARFGSGFGEAVVSLPAGQWSGPIASSYGLHLVWPHERGEQPGGRGAAEARARTEAHERASMQEALQILRRGVDVIRYDRPASP